MTQRGKIVQRDIAGNANIEKLAQFAEELRLFNAVDAQTVFEIDVKRHMFFRITRLVNNEFYKERFEFLRVQ